ncbi:3-deoxy-manno-octulosonate cytidylyltransferase [Acidobacteria bacterium AH-259-D05]|nr:3-deoxy-manno-octulosonate cytidylyltransferase [Acidobacteria bacterium AH-259-D05]
MIGIPARMGSSRLPGKPLAKICGMSMLEHVYRRCLLADNIEKIFIATCDDEIQGEVDAFNGVSIMTDREIPRPALRVYAAAETLCPDEDDIVITVQGDEPLIHPDMINSAVEPLLTQKDVFVSNVVNDIASDKEWQDPSNVKVVTDKNMNALYMSRSPIPSVCHEEYRGKRYLQVCVMPFRWHFFRAFNELEPGMLEQAESVEMLRAIEHGYKLRMVYSSHNTVSVDTEEDLIRAEKLMEKDKYFLRYGKRVFNG